jgi:hypothetical protein
MVTWILDKRGLAIAGTPMPHHQGAAWACQHNISAAPAARGPIAPSKHSPDVLMAGAIRGVKHGTAIRSVLKFHLDPLCHDKRRKQSVAN